MKTNNMDNYIVHIDFECKKTKFGSLQEGLLPNNLAIY